MTYELNNETLTIRLPLRIDTSSVAEAETEIGHILSTNPHKKVVFDATDLSYISSVGLRLVLKCKKENPDFVVENVSPEVYDIFEMTGFTQILKVVKKYRVISIEGCPLIGKGAYGKVYRLSPDTIVKSFFRGNPVSDIERERNLAKEAFVLGIPTAISYDIVKIKEEQLGSVYELIASDSLLDALLKNPSQYDSYLDQYIHLLDQMRNTKVSSPLIPSYKTDLSRRMDQCKGIVDEALLKKMQALIDSLPAGDRLIHGDCHFKNVFVTPDGLMLIDMDTLSKGDPLYELCCLYKTYVTFDVLDPGNTQHFFGVEGSFCVKLFEDLFEGLEKNNPEKKKLRAKVEAIGWFMYLSHNCLKMDKNADKVEKSTKILKEKLAAI